MTALTQRMRGRHRRVDLPQLLSALSEAVDALDGRADPGLLTRARALGAKAGERLQLSGEHTVVALAGSTGSGKSSVFNALCGADLSPVGIRRPTTAKPHACVWGVEGAASLVQWLGVPRKQTAWQHGSVVEDGSGLDGLVLLDLPDHDSTEDEHRVEVDRLVEMVDLLVWVVDPQKYADDVLHDRYLRALSNHAGSVVVLLNQIDTLNPFAAAECVEDLRRLVDADGLRRSPVIPCSAVTGAGLDDVRAVLATAVTRRQAHNDRLVGDVESVVYALAPSVSFDAEPDVGSGRTELVAALASAAGVDVIGRAVEDSWLLRSQGALGWPPTRWVRRLRRDPLRRMHLRGGERREVRAMVRSSVPEPTPVQRAQVDSAVSRVCTLASRELPPLWQQAVRRAAGLSRGPDLRDALDASIVGTDLGIDRVPFGWKLGGLLQRLLALAALVGGVWLGLLALNGYLRLPDVPTPDIPAPWDASAPGIPVPTALLAGGVLLGLLIALLGRATARAGARLRRKRAESRLRKGISRVADEMVIAPVLVEVDRHSRARTALQRAAGE